MTARSSVVAQIDAPDLGIGADRRRVAVGDDAPLVQHRDLLGDREHDGHVVFGEQQRQPALMGDALR